ncbi:amino acid aminotransferase [Mycolicibacterium bacteremicum]|uniref:amino acid aminotransferase n=1 Tax=Mycolicibacterium bacteremicum TaxID=564198 RepID=UPI0026F040D5|nr:amino acid aminotransferase [Mycolicibacterium bacteremicum]
MTTTLDSPETAALDFIDAIARAVPDAAALRAVLRNLAGALHIDGALAGLATIGDARIAAATITDAAATSDDPVGALRIRAAAVRAGCWDCSDPGGLADALDAAASVLDRF